MDQIIDKPEEVVSFRKTKEHEDFCTMKTLKQLIEYCKDNPSDLEFLELDNDDTYFTRLEKIDVGGSPILESIDEDSLFRMHPDELLRALLDYVGLPWEDV